MDDKVVAVEYVQISDDVVDKKSIVHCIVYTKAIIDIENALNKEMNILADMTEHRDRIALELHEKDYKALCDNLRTIMDNKDYVWFLERTSGSNSRVKDK